nr:MAG TPA: hypothetical protein [Caudoviricetes sp.]
MFQSNLHKKHKKILYNYNRRNCNSFMNKEFCVPLSREALSFFMQR